MRSSSLLASSLVLALASAASHHDHDNGSNRLLRKSKSVTG
jgi:hypothetical protein